MIFIIARMFLSFFFLICIMQNVNELDLKLNVPYLTEMEIQLLVDKV